MNNLQSWGFSYNPKEYYKAKQKQNLEGSGSPTSYCTSRPYCQTKCVNADTLSECAKSYSFEKSASASCPSAAEATANKCTWIQPNIYSGQCYADDYRTCQVNPTAPSSLIPADSCQVTSIEYKDKVYTGYNCDCEALFTCTLPVEGCENYYSDIVAENSLTNEAVTKDAFEDWCTNGFCPLSVANPRGVFEEVYTPSECTTCTPPPPSGRPPC